MYQRNRYEELKNSVDDTFLSYFAEHIFAWRFTPNNCTLNRRVEVGKHTSLNTWGDQCMARSTWKPLVLKQMWPNCKLNFHSIIEREIRVSIVDCWNSPQCVESRLLLLVDAIHSCDGVSWSPVRKGIVRLEQDNWCCQCNTDVNSKLLITYPVGPFEIVSISLKTNPETCLGREYWNIYDENRPIHYCRLFLVFFRGQAWKK